MFCNYSLCNLKFRILQIYYCIYFLFIILANFCNIRQYYTKIKGVGSLCYKQKLQSILFKNNECFSMFLNIHIEIQEITMKGR